VSDLSDDRAALSRRDLLKSAALAGVAVGTAGLWSPAIAENISCSSARMTRGLRTSESYAVRKFA